MWNKNFGHKILQAVQRMIYSTHCKNLQPILHLPREESSILPLGREKCLIKIKIQEFVQSLIDFAYSSPKDIYVTLTM